MSKVFNMVGGGGGKNISSIVITGLLSTDTVTCTKDGKSYTPAWNETEQRWEIVGLPLGTFTINAIRGDKTRTETVLIDISGVYEIAMPLQLYLYREDDECIDVTGGWTDSGYSSNDSIYTVLPASKQSGYVLFKTNGLARIFALGTINKINLTGYKKLYVDLDNTYTNIGAIYTLFGRAASDKILYAEKQYSLANTTGRQVVSVDISSIEGNNYIMFYLFGYSGDGTKYASTNLYNAWLE